MFLCDFHLNLGRSAGVLLLRLYRYGKLWKERREGGGDAIPIAYKRQTQISEADQMTLKSFPSNQFWFFGLIFMVLEREDRVLTLRT